MSENPLRSLPSVTTVLDSPFLGTARTQHGHAQIVDAVRAVLEQIRTEYARPNSATLPDLEIISNRVSARLRLESQPLLRTVINATGVVLHTNLGRAPLHEDAARAAYDAARGYLNLELDLTTGKRSSRQDAIRAGVCKLTGAESATAVNNCAAATILALRSVAAGKEVIVSRGQLIEIGGSFRIPDILAVSGATLREVGTTNITRESDYEQAVGPDTGAILRVHASNYRVTGFTKDVGIERLVEIGRKHGLPVIDDVGSGLAVELGGLGFQDEPLARNGVRAGADLVLFSGDKLLGGPQAGIVAGKKAWVEKMEADPLMRAFRLDKMTLAALAVTLQKYQQPATVTHELPTLRMLFMPVGELRTRAEQFVARLREATAGATFDTHEGVSYVGGGSLPDQSLPTVVIALASAAVREAEIARRLRVGTPAVMGRVHAGKVLLDLRTVFDWQESDLLDSVVRAVT